MHACVCVSILHLDSVQQHSIGDPDAVGNLTLDANGHVGANFAVLADFGGRMDNVVTHKAVAMSQRAGVPLPH